MQKKGIYVYKVELLKTLTEVANSSIFTCLKGKMWNRFIATEISYQWSMLTQNMGVQLKCNFCISARTRWALETYVQREGLQRNFVPGLIQLLYICRTDYVVATGQTCPLANDIFFKKDTNDVMCKNKFLLQFKVLPQSTASERCVASPLHLMLLHMHIKPTELILEEEMSTLCGEKVGRELTELTAWASLLTCKPEGKWAAFWLKQD